MPLLVRVSFVMVHARVLMTGLVASSAKRVGGGSLYP